MGRKRKDFTGGISESESAVGLAIDSTSTGSNTPEEKASSEAQPDSLSFSVEEVKTLDDEKRLKKLESAARWRERKRAKSAGVALPDNPDILTAASFLTVLDSLVIAWVGVQGAMLPHERQMIEQPLIRMLARMDDGTREAVNKWADPIMIFSGLSMYLMRAVAIQQDKREALQEVTRKPQPDPIDYQPTEAQPIFDFTPVSQDPDIGAASPSRELLASVGNHNGVKL